MNQAPAAYELQSSVVAIRDGVLELGRCGDVLRPVNVALRCQTRGAHEFHAKNHDDVRVTWNDAGEWRTSSRPWARGYPHNLPASIAWHLTDKEHEE